MRRHVQRFLIDTEGAVVADYVVLSAAIVVSAINSVSAVRNGIGTLGLRINETFVSAEVYLGCATDATLSLGECGPSRNAPITGGVRPPREAPPRLPSVEDPTVGDPLAVDTES